MAEHRSEREAFDAMSQKAIADHLRRSSTTYLECCISLMLTHMTRAEVAEVLRAEAQMVEELG